MGNRLRATAAAVLALAAAPAAAESWRLAVVAFGAPADLAFVGRAAAAEAARAASRQPGFQVLGPDAVAEKLGPDAAAALARCGDDAICLGELGAPLGVDRIVSGYVSREGSTYKVTLVHVDARKRERIVAITRETPVAARRLNAEVAAAMTPLLLGSDAVGSLKVDSPTPGATVLVDGQKVGTTPFVRAMRPGKYRVEVRQGERSETFEVEVPADGVVVRRARLAP